MMYTSSESQSSVLFLFGVSPEKVTKKVVDMNGIELREGDKVIILATDSHREVCLFDGVEGVYMQGRILVGITPISPKSHNFKFTL